MRNDPIVEEMRMYGQKFVARHGNNVQRIGDALRQSEIVSRRKAIRRGPKRLKQDAANR